MRAHRQVSWLTAATLALGLAFPSVAQTVAYPFYTKAVDAAYSCGYSSSFAPNKAAYWIPFSPLRRSSKGTDAPYAKEQHAKLRHATDNAKPPQKFENCLNFAKQNVNEAATFFPLECPLYASTELPDRSRSQHGLPY